MTVSTAGLHELFARGASEGTYIDSFALDDTHLVLPASTAAHFPNHSCDPTMWWVDPLAMAARHDLSAHPDVCVTAYVVDDASGDADRERRVGRSLPSR